MIVDVKIVPVAEIPYSNTTGYWTYDEETKHLVLWVAKMSSPIHELAVLYHEWKESTWAIEHGVTQKEGDDFDAAYKGPAEYPGQDPKCPYYMGHMIGEAWERFIIAYFGGNWIEYDEETNRLERAQER